jgi:hypothetical protein
VTTYTYEPATVRPRRRWGRRLLIVFIVLLVVLGGLLVVADRVAASVAERELGNMVADQLVDQGAKSAPPEVTVGGFPFLTQVLAGKYESVQIRLRDLEGAVDGEGVRVPVVNVDARNVSASLETIRTGKGDVVAETIDGTATISYASVVALMDQPGVRLSEQGGKLLVTAPLDVAGQRVTLRGTAELSVANSRIQIRWADVTADGLPQIPGAQALLNQYARRISISVPVPELPFELDLRGVEARPDGLAVDAQALNVLLNQT